MQLAAGLRDDALLTAARAEGLSGEHPLCNPLPPALKRADRYGQGGPPDRPDIAAQHDAGQTGRFADDRKSA